VVVDVFVLVDLLVLVLVFAHEGGAGTHVES